MGRVLLTLFDEDNERMATISGTPQDVCDFYVALGSTPPSTFHDLAQRLDIDVDIEEEP